MLRSFLLFLPFFIFALPAFSLAEDSELFRVRLHEDLGTLDWNYGEVNSEIVYQLMEGLFRTDHEGHPVPAAAEKFRWNTTKTELMVKLRKNRLWSDGRPLCAQEFVDSWNRLRSKEFASPFAHYASVLKSYQANGCHELKIQFSRPAPEAPALLGHYVFFPLRRDNLEQYPKAFSEGSNLLVNGPFFVKEWRRNNRLILERNQSFSGAKPKLRKVEFLFLPEDSTAKAMFERGELDWMKDVPQLIRTPELEKSPDFRIFPSLIVYYFGLNATKSSLLADSDIREALSAALDRKEIPKVLGQECKGTESWLVAELFPLRKRLGKKVSESAKKKLAAAVQAGKMDLLARTYNKTAHKLLLEWAQGQWEKKLGVRIPIEVQESKIYWKEIGVSPAPIFFGGVTAPFSHPRAFLQEFLKTSTANWTGWNSDSFDETVNRANYEKAEEILERDGFIIPIYQRHTVALVRAKWKGFHVNPLGQAFLSEVH